MYNVHVPLVILHALLNLLIIQGTTRHLGIKGVDNRKVYNMHSTLYVLV